MQTTGDGMSANDKSRQYLVEGGPGVKGAEGTSKLVSARQAC